MIWIVPVVTSWGPGLSDATAKTIASRTATFVLHKFKFVEVRSQQSDLDVKQQGQPLDVSSRAYCSSNRRAMWMMSTSLTARRSSRDVDPDNPVQVPHTARPERTLPPGRHELSERLGREQLPSTFEVQYVERSVVLNEERRGLPLSWDPFCFRYVMTAMTWSREFASRFRAFA
jgi:hypothetical protein